MNGEDEKKKESSRGSWISSILPESLAKPLNEADKALNPFRKVSDFLENPTKPKKDEEETLPRRRKGGPVKKGKPYLVGEEGPEVFVPEKDGKIIPNKKTKGKEMPAKSKKQQRIMGMARAIQKGEMSPSESPEAAKIAKSMKPSDVEEFASTPHKGLPEKVKPEKPKATKTKQLRIPKKPPAESEAPPPSPPMPTMPPTSAGPPEAPPQRTKPQAVKMPPGEPAPPPSPTPARVPKRTMGGILSDLKRSRRMR